MSEFAKGGLIPKAEWKVGDKVNVVKLSSGYLCMNQAAMDRLGIKQGDKINGTEIRAVVVVPEPEEISFRVGEGFVVE